MTPPLSPDLEDSFEKLYLAIELAMKQNRVLRIALRMAVKDLTSGHCEWNLPQSLPEHWIKKAQEIIDKEEGK